MPFPRESVRHPLVARRVSVSEVRRLVPSMVRVTFTGPELNGFTSLGPTDHVKLFFPDRESGVSRDYTPRATRVGDDGSTELDIDVVIHGDEGPASAWASRAEVGSTLEIGGPRGSRLVPTGLERLLIVADETAFPAASRWLELTPPEVPVTALFDAADPSVVEYFAPEALADVETHWLFRENGPDQVETALRSLGAIDSATFVFLAGEATALVPLRRYLRRELSLPAEQVSASGYWKRGVTALDHHAPLDPSDPD